MKRLRYGVHLFGILLLFAGVKQPASAEDFQRTVISSQVPNAFDVTVADFDNDGDLDIAATDNDAGSVRWVENIGSGYTIHVVATIGSSRPRGISAGDFDGDGDADIVFAAYHENRFILLENTGTGTTNRFRMWTLHDSSHGAWSVNCGDADDDGDLDLVLTEFRGNTVRIMTRSGSTWSEQAFSVHYPLDAVFADFDSDGDMDVVGGCNYSEMFWIEQANHGEWIVRPLGFGTYATAVAVADLDDDGDQDVAASLLQDNAVAWWERTPTQFVGDTVSWSVSQPRDVVAADFDLDGRMDLAACSQVGTIAWFRQTDGGLTVHPMANGTSFRAMVVADFDRDGDPDIITADYDGAEIAFYSNTIVASACVEGTVSAELDGSLLAGVEIRLIETDLTVQTAMDGSFRLCAAPGMRTLIARHPCWNESSIASLGMISGDTVTQNFFLTRPLLGLRLTSLNVTVNNHVPYEVVMRLSNLGDGVLHVAAAARGNMDNDPWLSVNPSHLIIPAGDIGLLTVRIAADTSDTGIWDYFGEITLRTNACPDSVRRIAVIAYVLDAPERADVLPQRTALRPLYPNPFNGITRARLELATECDVDLSVMDLLGREAMRVFHGWLNAGEHTMNVNASELASGVYFLSLRAGMEAFTQKMLLIR